MLTEIRNARQINGEGTRRWFTDEFFDLIVWYGDTGAPTGFQLCYDKQEHERAITWTEAHGFQHNRIDSGEVPGHAKMTPVVVADGAFDRDPVVKRFQKASQGLPPDVTAFVSRTLESYTTR
jgi:hypothetical protein